MLGSIKCNFEITMSPEKLNILFLNSIETAVWGGLENWIAMVAEGLSEKGHSVYVAGRKQSEFLRRISASGRLIATELNLSGDFNPLAVLGLRRLIRAKGIDFTLCNFVRDVRLAGLARILTSKFKIIWTPGVNLARKTISHRLLFRNFVDGAVVPSNFLKNEIVASGYVDRARFHTIPIGLDVKFWSLDKFSAREELIARYGLSRDKFICLTSGRFVPQKGHEYLINSAAELCSKYPNVRFIFLGDGPLENRLRQKIKNLDLEKYFIFAGLMDDHRRIVAGADLYIHPAIIEPYGIVLVEAMAAGLAIVASEIGGIPEVINRNENALLIKPADPAELTKAIERLYNDNDLRLNLGSAGRKRFEKHFNRETMIENIEKYLQEQHRR